MPRFLLETPLITEPHHDDATELARRRYPEVAVEHRYAAVDATTARDIWVCRAPSEGHVRRWAEAAGLPFRSVQRMNEITPTKRTKETP